MVGDCGRQRIHQMHVNELESRKTAVLQLEEKGLLQDMQLRQVQNELEVEKNKTWEAEKNVTCK